MDSRSYLCISGPCSWIVEFDDYIGMLIFFGVRLIPISFTYHPFA